MAELRIALDPVDFKEAIGELAELMASRRIPERLMAEIETIVDAPERACELDMSSSPARLTATPRFAALLANLRVQPEIG
jgi:hypothetical protein